MSTLREIIHENVREGELYEKLDRNWVRCFACGHCCKIPDGQPGVCKVRYNPSGSLFVPWGYVASIQCDVSPHCKSKDEAQRWGSLLCRNLKEELDERASTRCCFKGM
jgi:hypothetical protein